MVEVIGDGTGHRHRRYLLRAPNRKAAHDKIIAFLGASTLITSTSRIAQETLAVVELKEDQIVQI